MNRDLAFGAAGVAVAAGYYALAARIQQSALADAVGPQGLPRAYALVLGALSLVLIVESLRRRSVSPASAAWQPPPVSRVAGLLLIGVAYLAVVSWLGYLASLGGLILATAWYQGGVMRRQIVMVAAGGALFFWLLFVLILGIRHPAGVWERFF